MRTGLFFFRTLLLCAFFWLLSASSASAQCGAEGVAYGDVSLVPDNPFHAEVVTTGSSRPQGTLSPFPRHPELVARDSEGRVRIERISGEYLRQTGPDAGTKAEMHLIMICDPVAQTITQIDTATSPATIYHSRALSLGGLHSSLSSVPPKSYCSSFFTRPHPSNFAVEDLGFQNKEGLEVRGQRISLIPPNPGDPEVPTVHSMTTEQWCSEQVGVMVSTERLEPKTGRKSMRTMINIERVEPDPELFKIPQGYTVAERVPETTGRTPGSSTVVPAPNPSQ
jgi:hypothetical protein